jgi:predicted MPP superfamily phosphohydrolase
MKAKYKNPEAGTGKRKHWKLKAFLIVLLVLVVALAATVGVNVWINRDFTVTFYQLRSDKVSDNIRIIELADLHNKEYGAGNIKLINKIRDLHPDLIFYAGDMMNDGDSDYSVLFHLSDELSEIAPIYACFGNNEIDQYLFIDKSLVSGLEEHHVNFLSNEAVNIKVKNTVIQLVVVSDNVDQYDIETNNGKKFVEALEPTANCRICLTHYPELFKEKLLDKGIDFAFVGHSHGGLIRIPYIGGLYSHGEGFLPKMTEGVYTAKDGAQVVISRGLGDSSKIPRINNQPELVVADICWY